MAPAEPLEGLTVLALDDHVAFLEALTDMLEACGARVVPARTAATALRCLDTVLPDVIVSDIAMPEMDGFAFLASVRNRPAASGGHVPVIALTAHATEDFARHARAMGFRECLGKPIEGDVLCATIVGVVARTRS